MHSTRFHARPSPLTASAQLLASRAAIPKVLLAEDDHEMRRLLLRSLPTHRFKVLEVGSGLSLLDAARRLQRHGVAPDLIVTDVRMPGLDGLDVLKTVRQWGWDMPALIVTAFPDEDVLAKARELGVVRVFGKPFELPELTETVDGLFADGR